MGNTINTVLAFTLMLSVLKLSGDLAISWWVVTCLIWIPTAIVLAIILLIMTLAFISLNGTTKKLKDRRKK